MFSRSKIDIHCIEPDVEHIFDVTGKINTWLVNTNAHKMYYFIYVFDCN
jgi:hypothetical protein